MAWMAWGGTILSMNFGCDDFDGGENDGQKPIGCYCGAKEFVSVLLCCEGLGYIFFFAEGIEGSSNITSNDW